MISIQDYKRKMQNEAEQLKKGVEELQEAIKGLNYTMNLIITNITLLDGDLRFFEDVLKHHEKGEK